MPYAIAELLAILTMVFLIGTFILLFPISRRLGKAIEEWIRIRHESTPERDLLARYGGEEFTVLLPQTIHTEAATVAKRIKKSVGFGRDDSCKPWRGSAWIRNGFEVRPFISCS